jgi:hypothetical protein
MNIKSLWLGIVLAGWTSSSIGFAQGTAFTYQGQLSDGELPASGIYDLTFGLFTTSNGPGQIGGTLTSAATPVSNGLFTVTLDFGANYPGADRWLELAVRTNGAGGYTTLTPRQKITAAPYAVTAGTLTGPITETQLPVNAAKLNVANTATQATAVPVITSGFITGATVLSGGSGYLTPPNVSVNAPQGSGAIITAGITGGVVTGLTVQNAGSGYTAGATITIAAPPSNGFQVFASTNYFTMANFLTNANNTFAGNFSGNGSALTNLSAWQLGGNAGTAPGAQFIGTTDNQPLEFRANHQRVLRLEGKVPSGAPNFIGGGPRNFVGGGVIGATISGGGATNYGGLAYTNSSLGDFTAIGGGAGNGIASGSIASSIGGGINNDIRINSGYSTIGGGGDNNVANDSSVATIGGGLFNNIGTNSSRSTVGGGANNTVANNSTNITIAGGVDNDVGANAGDSTIGGGGNNSIASGSLHTTIPGGRNNAVGAGSSYSTIGGGFNNQTGTNCLGSTIGGGNDNAINNASIWSTIAGGSLNVIMANTLFSTIAGGAGNLIEVNGSANVIGGGQGNRIRANVNNGTVAGGGQNEIESGNGSYGFIGGGENNRINSTHTTIGGGAFNIISISSSSSTIGGGSGNLISASSPSSTIGGGNGNLIAANSPGATIPGGAENAATNYAFAAGRQAKANHTGSFVWGDSTAANLNSAAANSVTLRAAGGYRLFSNSGTTIGVSLAASGNAWAAISDRNRKKDILPLDERQVLDKLAGIPISAWHYDFEAADSTPHIGPMAQDFKAAFYPGRDDKTISTMEFDGVALAAIQGLNQKLEAAVAEKNRELVSLRDELEALKHMVQQMASVDH